MEHTRFPYSPINERPRFALPNGARVAVWVIPNIEHFHFDKPSTSLTNFSTRFSPDVLNYSWRDYGARVGAFRLMDLMDKYAIKGTAALNAEACDRNPQIIEAGRQLRWEWMGHGANNSTLLAGLDEADERAMIADVLARIEQATGSRPRGWLSPVLTETFNTPDLLAEQGVDYVADWVNDDQPYPMRVRSGSLYSIPYSMEINDIPAFIEHHMTGEEFARMIMDQFDVLYEEGGETGRVMSIGLHTFLVGHPHRSKYLEQAFRHITSRSDVWLATGSEIIDHYKRTVPADSVMR
ncbi:polysaccharide deacetylase family protein [Cupriavidus nantongensis]|uniref:polysaccharide deacetylase family protein n=1 Tax=Cupriavidus nantongensis TaxID=1796606 RepID=UPI00358F633E